MKQYRITSKDILAASDDDCFLDENDPIHQLKIAHNLGGLGSEAKLAEYNAKLARPVNNTGNDNARIMREQGIKSGSDAWFRLWFGAK